MRRILGLFAIAHLATSEAIPLSSKSTKDDFIEVVANQQPPELYSVKCSAYGVDYTGAKVVGTLAQQIQYRNKIKIEQSIVTANKPVNPPVSEKPSVVERPTKPTRPKPPGGQGCTDTTSSQRPSSPSKVCKPVQSSHSELDKILDSHIELQKQQSNTISKMLKPTKVINPVEDTDLQDRIDSITNSSAKPKQREVQKHQEYESSSSNSSDPSSSYISGGRLKIPSYLKGSHRGSIRSNIVNQITNISVNVGGSNPTQSTTLQSGSTNPSSVSINVANHAIASNSEGTVQQQNSNSAKPANAQNPYIQSKPTTTVGSNDKSQSQAAVSSDVRFAIDFKHQTQNNNAHITPTPTDSSQNTPSNVTPQPTTTPIPLIPSTKPTTDRKKPTNNPPQLPLTPPAVTHPPSTDPVVDPKVPINTPQTSDPNANTSAVALPVVNTPTTPPVTPPTNPTNSNPPIVPSTSTPITSVVPPSVIQQTLPYQREQNITIKISNKANAVSLIQNVQRPAKQPPKAPQKPKKKYSWQQDEQTYMQSLLDERVPNKQQKTFISPSESDINDSEDAFNSYFSSGEDELHHYLDEESIENQKEQVSQLVTIPHKNQQVAIDLNKMGAGSSTATNLNASLNKQAGTDNSRIGISSLNSASSKASSVKKIKDYDLSNSDDFSSFLNQANTDLSALFSVQNSQDSLPTQYSSASSQTVTKPVTTVPFQSTTPTTVTLPASRQSLNSINLNFLSASDSKSSQLTMKPSSPSPPASPSIPSNSNSSVKKLVDSDQRNFDWMYDDPVPQKPKTSSPPSAPTLKSLASPKQDQELSSLLNSDELNSDSGFEDLESLFKSFENEQNGKSQSAKPSK